MAQKNFTQTLYEEHHAKGRAPGFSILKEERGRIFSDYIGKGKKVLDIGCRDGALTKFFVEGNTVVGIDVDAVALERAKGLGIDTLHMDIYGSWDNLSGKKFDAIVAGEVLEHLFYPEKILSKINAHLKDGGIFIGSVPNAFSLVNRFRYLRGTKKYTPLSDPTHINHFSHKELFLILSEQFSSVTISPLGRFSIFDKLWPGMFSFDLLFFCKK